MSFKSVIYNSICKDGKPSSSRIFAYLMMLQIMLTGLTYIGIEITNAIIAFNTKGFYTIPLQHITVFTSLLLHQLALLGIYKYHENKSGKSIPDKQETAAEDTSV